MQVAERRPRATRIALAAALAVPSAMMAAQGMPMGLPGLMAGLMALAAAVRPHGARRAGLLLRLGLQLVLLGILMGLFLLLCRGADSPRRAGLYLAMLMLALAAPGPWFLQARSGHALTLALGLIGWMGFSRSAQALLFGLGTSAYLLAGFLAMMLSDPTWGRVGRRPRGLLLPMVAALLLAGGIMAGLGQGLNAAEGVVAEALEPYLLRAHGVASSGFNPGRVRLGHLREILLSDTVVMRIWGGPTDYLRGQVYVTYGRGSWLRGPARLLARESSAGRVQLGQGPTRRSLRIEAQAETGHHLFAPLTGVALLGAHPETTLDTYGVVQVPASLIHEPRDYRVELGVDGMARGLVAGPDETDLSLPPALRPRLELLARQWSRAAGSDPERAEELLGRLRQDFGYSLSMPASPSGMDPVWFFLSRVRSGHCELFASGLVLLARALGIPARLVGGFRVFEHNGPGGYYVVRQRDAHAWAELYLDGRWQTVDPTPPGVLPGEQLARSGWLRGQWDRVLRAMGRAWDRLAELSAAEIVIAMLAIGVLMLLLFWLRQRRSRGPARGEERPEVFLPLQLLERCLAARGGLSRPRHETLGAFSRQLVSTGLPAAAGLVEACARLRYGGHGDRDELDAQVERYVLDHGSKCRGLTESSWGDGEMGR